jgi:hypothetical protein
MALPLWWLASSAIAFHAFVSFLIMILVESGKTRRFEREAAEACTA